MERRHFIRLIGGGVVVAAATATTGCSSAYPPEAVTAWEGPGAEPDPRRWALAHAILAPNSHNRQPWLVDLREPNTITLRVDLERTLPMTDPWFRQIVISQGTFIEALVLALKARGLDPQVALFPEGALGARTLDARPVARVFWTPGAAAPAHDPLFAQLRLRHTAKVPYDTARPVAADTLAQLATVLHDPDVRHGATVDAGQVAALRELCWRSAQVELLTPRTVMESLRLTRVGPAEIARHRDGISVNGWLPRLADAVGAFDRTNPPAEGSTAYRQMMERFESHSRSAMGFVWLSTAYARDAAAGTTRHAEVRAGRAYLRLQLKATELGLQVHPMSQAPQEFEEMKPHRDRLQQLLLGRPADEEVVQMFCRVGYCAPQPHTPRRALDGFVVRAA
jgi:nitroreductase